MPWPSAGPAGDRVVALSTARQARAPRHRPGRQPCQPDAPAHRSAAPRWMQASQASGAGPPVRHAIARQWPDTPGRRCASPRCAVSPERSSIPTAPAGGRSPVCPCPAHAGSQAPPAPQATGIARRAALPIVQTSLVACRLPPETNVLLPVPTRPHQSPRPRSIPPPRSIPKNAAGASAARPEVAPANAACSATHDPTDADLPSQPPCPECCDDQLNSPNSQHTPTAACWTSMGCGAR